MTECFDCDNMDCRKYGCILPSAAPTSDRTHEYSPDEQRVAEWIISKTNGHLGGGDDPIGFLLASYEMLHEELKGKKNA